MGKGGREGGWEGGVGECVPFEGLLLDRENRAGFTILLLQLSTKTKENQSERKAGTKTFSLNNRSPSLPPSSPYLVKSIP